MKIHSSQDNVNMEKDVDGVMPIVGTICKVLDDYVISTDQDTMLMTKPVVAQLSTLHWNKGWAETIAAWSFVAWLDTHVKLERPPASDAYQVILTLDNDGIQVREQTSCRHVKWSSCDLTLLKTRRVCKDLEHIIQSALDASPEWWSYASSDVQRSFVAHNRTEHIHARVTHSTLFTIQHRVRRWFQAAVESRRSVYVLVDGRASYHDMSEGWNHMVMQLCTQCGLHPTVLTVDPNSPAETLPPSGSAVIAMHNVLEYVYSKAKEQERLQMDSWVTFMFNTEHYGQRSYVTAWTEALFNSATLIADYDPLSTDYLRGRYGNAFWFPSVAGYTPRYGCRKDEFSNLISHHHTLKKHKHVARDLVFVGKDRSQLLDEYVDVSKVSIASRSILDSETFDELHDTSLCSLSIARGIPAFNAYLLCRNLRTSGLSSVVMHVASRCHPSATMCYKDVAVHVWSSTDVSDSVAAIRIDKARLSLRIAHENALVTMINECCDVLVSVLTANSGSSLPPPLPYTLGTMYDPQTTTNRQLKSVASSMSTSSKCANVYIFADDAAPSAQNAGVYQAEGFIQGLAMMNHAILSNRPGYKLFGHHKHLILHDKPGEDIRALSSQSEVLLVLCVCGLVDSLNWITKKFQHFTNVYIFHYQDHDLVPTSGTALDSGMCLRNVCGFNVKEIELFRPFLHRAGRNNAVILHGSVSDSYAARVHELFKSSKVPCLVKTSVDVFTLVQHSVYWPLWVGSTRAGQKVIPINLWHAFACACLVVLPDLQHHCVDVPFPLVPYVHYIPVKLDDPNKTVEELRTMTLEQMQRIANRGKEYVLASYTVHRLSAYVVHSCRRAHSCVYCPAPVADTRNDDSVSALSPSVESTSENAFDLVDVRALQTPWESTLVYHNAVPPREIATYMDKIKSADDEQYWYAFDACGSDRPLLATTQIAGQNAVNFWIHQQELPDIQGHEMINIWVCSRLEQSNRKYLITHEWNENHGTVGYRSWILDAHVYGLQKVADLDTWRYDIKSSTSGDYDTLDAVRVTSVRDDVMHGRAIGTRCFYAVRQKKKNTHFVVFKRCQMPLYVWDTVRSAMDAVSLWYNHCEVVGLQVIHNARTNEQTLKFVSTSDDNVGYVFISKSELQTKG